MVSKCFNPACSTPFHSLAEGTVFRLEPDGSFTNTTVDAEYTDAQLFMAIQRRYPVQNHRDRSKGRAAPTSNVDPSFTPTDINFQSSEI
jgi:hypothetical protein